jgi:hypothetical protein
VYILPYVLWAFVALFFWWLCGTIALVFETLAQEMDNKRLEYRRWRPLTPDEKRRDIRAGPIALVVFTVALITSGWRLLTKDTQKGFFIRPFAVVGSKVGDYLVSVFITKSKGF